VPSDDDKAEILGVLMGRVSISARAVLQRKLDSSPAELLGMLAHHPLGPQHSGSSSAAVQMAAEDAELEQLLEDLADEPTSDDVDPSTEEQQDGADADAEADADADADMRLLLPGKRSRRSASDSSTEVELEAP
jgi:hypothetical protein